MDWGKAASSLLVVFGGFAWLIGNCDIFMPLSPHHLLLLPKRVGDVYNQGRVLIVGGHYNLRHITKNRNLEEKPRQRSGYTEGSTKLSSQYPGWTS